MVRVVSDKFDLVCLVVMLGLQVCLGSCGLACIVQQFWIHRFLKIFFGRLNHESLIWHVWWDEFNLLRLAWKIYYGKFL